jgi:hypothetical protein
MLRVVRPEKGIRIYAAHEHRPEPVDEIRRTEWIGALADAAVKTYAPRSVFGYCPSFDPVVWDRDRLELLWRQAGCRVWLCGGYALRFATVTVIGSGWLLSSNKILPMPGTLGKAVWPVCHE